MPNWVLLVEGYFKAVRKIQILLCCVPNKGNTALLWLENWSGNTLKNRFRQLFSFAKKQKCSVQFFISQEVSRIFSIPMTSHAASQLAGLQVLLNDRHMNPDINDTWTYSWGANFHARKA